MAGDQTEHSVPNYGINFKCSFPLAFMWLSLTLPDAHEEQSDAQKKKEYLLKYLLQDFLSTVLKFLT